MRARQGAWIYGLVDPTDHSVHYVGKTTNPEERWSDHLHDGCIASEATMNARALWIRGLLDRGAAPFMVILEHVRPFRLWPERERWWIAEGRRLKWPLTNVSEGGEGPGTPYNNNGQRGKIRKVPTNGH